MHGFTENYIRLQTPFDKSKINIIESVVIGPDNCAAPRS